MKSPTTPMTLAERRAAPEPLLPSSWRLVAIATAIALIVLGLAWELLLAPLRPGGSWLALKVLPLLPAVIGMIKRRLYTFRWVSLLVWLYVTEGLVRATSDKDLLSRQLGWVEAVLAGVLFVAVAIAVRSVNQIYKARQPLAQAKR